MLKKASAQKPPSRDDSQGEAANGERECFKEKKLDIVEVEDGKEIQQRDIEERTREEDF